MKIKKLLAVMLIVAMAASMFTACGKKSDSDSSTGDRSAYPGTTEENGITVNITSEPPQMNSIITSDNTSFTVIRHIIENLVELDENDNVIPGVAKDWTVSDDGLVYTFNLRDDMKWTNGEPVTANDFVFAWKTLLTPDAAAPYASFGFVFKNGSAFYDGSATADQLGFKALSDYQLEVTLENPTSYFLNQLAFGVFAPVNEKAYNEIGAANYGTDADKIVSNGPFTMTSWEHESQIVLTKNPDYYDAANISLETITMVMINDENAALNSFKAGEIDMVNLNGDQSAAIKGENYPVNTYNDGAVAYLQFNIADPQFANANLRKAISYALDKQAFIDSVMKNSSQPALGFTVPGIKCNGKDFAAEVGALLPAVDATKAKEFYDKALAELGVDKVSFSMITDDTDTALKTGAFIQEQLKNALGIEVSLESMPFKSRIERMNNKDFTVVMALWGPDYNDPMTYLDLWETTNGNNYGSYSNTAYDELIGKARTEVNAETRMGYLMDAEKMLCDELPIAPVYWRYRDYVLSGKVESGVLRTAFQDMNFRNVKLAK